LAKLSIATTIVRRSVTASQTDVPNGLVSRLAIVCHLVRQSNARMRHIATKASNIHQIATVSDLSNKTLALALLSKAHLSLHDPHHPSETPLWPGRGLRSVTWSVHTKTKRQLRYLANLPLTRTRTTAVVWNKCSGSSAAVQKTDILTPIPTASAGVAKGSNDSVIDSRTVTLQWPVQLPHTTLALRLVCLAASRMTALMAAPQVGLG
jgi:hypothetical protein